MARTLARWSATRLAGLVLSLPLALAAATGTTDPGFAAVPAIAELSGLAVVGGFAWAHADSGAPPRLWRVRIDPPDTSAQRPATTTTWRPVVRGIDVVDLVGAPARDWEDIAHDGESLWIADTGNNFGRRRTVDLIRVVPPASGPPPRVLDVSDRLSIDVPRWRGAHGDAEWDFEALVVSHSVAWLLSKPRRFRAGPFVPGSTLLRVLCTPDGCRLLPVQTFAHLDSVTAADLSPDGRRLAILTRSALHVHCWEPGATRPVGPGQIVLAFHPREWRQPEAVAWLDARHLLIGDELRGIVGVRLGTGTPEPADCTPVDARS